MAAGLAGCLSDADERAYYDRTGRERSAGAVGHSHADAEEIFRQFFGEDFDMASAGAGGVHFHSFGGGVGQSGFVFNMGGMGAPGGGAAGGAGGMAQNFLPWPLGEVLSALVSVVPGPFLFVGFMWAFFHSAAWFMMHFVYFMPGAHHHTACRWYQLRTCLSLSLSRVCVCVCVCEYECQLFCRERSGALLSVKQRCAFCVVLQCSGSHRAS